MKTVSFFTLVLFLSATTMAQSKEERAVAQVVSEFGKAMLDGDSLSLVNLTDEKLVYGHSSGKMESQQEFVSSLASGTSDFKSLNISNQTVIIRGATAAVRHHLKGNVVDNGKEAAVNLSVLMVWYKAKKSWKLLSRQAVKII